MGSLRETRGDSVLRKTHSRLELHKIMTINKTAFASSNQHQRLHSSNNRPLSKGLATIAIALMTLGFMGVNLFNFESYVIFTFRFFLVLVIAILLASELRDARIHRLMLVVGAIAAISAITSSIMMNLLFIAFFVFATRSLSIQFLAKVSVIVLGIAIVTTYAVLYFGTLISDEDVLGVAFELGGGLRSRMNFGYNNPNNFPSIVSAFCLLLMMSGKHAFIRCLVALTLSINVYDQTDSRTMIVATSFFIVYVATLSFFARYTRMLFILSTTLLLSVVVISLFPEFFVSQFPILDFYLSGRLFIVSSYYSEIPAFRLLIGGMDPTVGVGTVGTAVDNSFALITGAAGVPALFYVISRLLSKIRHCILASDHRLHAFLISFWLFSFAESSLVRPEVIIGLLFWAVILRPNDFLNYTKPSKV